MLSLRIFVTYVSSHQSWQQQTTVESVLKLVLWWLRVW